MSDYINIYLQPECCAGEEGRLWCQDDEPETCPDGVKWTPYILLSEYTIAQSEIEALREENERVRQANLDVMMHFEDMKAVKEKAEARVAELEALIYRKCEHFLLRKQAEAVKESAQEMLEEWPEFDVAHQWLIVRSESLAQQADEAERAGGEE